MKIGHVDFTRPGPDGDIAYRATLDDSTRAWTIEPDDEFLWAIRVRLAEISEGYGGPADGPFGPGQLAEAAAQLGGTYHVEPRPAPPDDVAF
jgi:hypothetical protein